MCTLNKYPVPNNPIKGPYIYPFQKSLVIFTLSSSSQCRLRSCSPNCSYPIIFFIRVEIKNPNSVNYQTLCTTTTLHNVIENNNRTSLPEQLLSDNVQHRNVKCFVTKFKTEMKKVHDEFHATVRNEC